MANFRIDKILAELEKATPEEQVEAFKQIKEFVTATLIAEQRAAEEKSNKLQQTIDNL